MRQVPYTRVTGLPPEAQRQLQRNFEVAVATLAAGGGRVKVPYTKITGLPPEAQRQIQRNFEDLVCSGAAAVGDPSAAILADTPIGYWKLHDAFGATTFVSAGSISPGGMTVNGTPTLQETVAGEVSTRFNGTNDFGSLSDAGGWSPHQGASGTMSAEAWVYPRAFAARMEIITKGGNASQFEWEMYLDATGHLVGNVLTLAGADVMVVTGATALPLNTWSHVAFTYNRATPLIAVYVNGVLDGSSGSASGTSGDGTAQTQIAKRSFPTGTTLFAGNLAHVAVFSTALSAARVAAHAAFIP